jgi:hypothetical protein
MGVAYASGLSKNSSWARSDAVVPVLKVCHAHFVYFTPTDACVAALCSSREPSIRIECCAIHGIWETASAVRDACAFQGCRAARWSTRCHDVRISSWHTTSILNSHLRAYHDIDGVPCVVSEYCYEKVSVCTKSLCPSFQTLIYIVHSKTGDTTGLLSATTPPSGTLCSTI